MNVIKILKFNHACYQLKQSILIENEIHIFNSSLIILIASFFYMCKNILVQNISRFDFCCNVFLEIIP